ncbi:MAG TPA: RecQ family zinc-binding domain-containing protein [Cyclobacteriaceae bacterium]
MANARFDPFIKTLLRIYGGELFSDFVTISENQLGKANNITDGEVRATLDQLHKLQLLIYEPASDRPRLTYLLPRQDADQLPVNKEHLEERRKLHLSKMESMIEFATQSHRCRMQLIQEYFDEVSYVNCGICDVCVDRKKKENLTALKDYREQVLYLLSQKPMTVEELESAVGPKDSELFIEVIREMVDEAVIEYDEFWTLRKKK